MNYEILWPDTVLIGYASVFQAGATGLKTILLWTTRQNIHAWQVDGDSKLIINMVQGHELTKFLGEFKLSFMISSC